MNQQPQFIPKSCLDVHEVMTTMMTKAHNKQLNPSDNQAFTHGMTWKEVKRTFGKRMGYTLGEYANRQRDLYHPYGLCGKHYVHDEIHYFPLSLDAKDMVDHKNCVNCRRKKETE